MTPRPRLAVFKMAFCDGCQLQLLHAEEALLDLAGALEVARFPEATSSTDPGPYDVTIVEGSVSTPEQEAEVREIRRKSRFLMTIGACATSGGVQALRNAGDLRRVARAVYPAPEYVRSLANSRPFADYVRVDLELTGCPVDRGQLLGALASLLVGALPRVSSAPVCLECKRRGSVCVVVAQGEPCLGPMTRTGCGALCPAFGRGCYGCFGPSRRPNTAALAGRLLGLGLTPEETADRFELITAWAPEFRQARLRAALVGRGRRAR